MKRSIIYIALLSVVGFNTACGSDTNENPDDSTLPLVETAEVTYITSRSALSGGTVTDTRGETITTRGICWNTSSNPTTADFMNIVENGSDDFLLTVTDLLPNTTYHVRAYATSINGTGYGRERIFTTLSDEEEGDDGSGRIYLWPQGSMAATTSYQTVANSSNPDGPDFRPYMVHFPAREGVAVKGAVMVCAGGAFQFRSDNMEGTPVAQALSQLGYHAFVVNYRLRPYTQQEGALDLARAVRYVRSRSSTYGINESDIAVIGFSAGGILCGEQQLNYKGMVNGSSLDSNYIPDELDRVSADAAAIGHIYSFYGRLSVASTDVEQFRRSDLPPAFFCYGTQDPFVNQFAACVNALRQANVPVETYILDGWPHGYGYRGDWIPVFDRWLTLVMGR